MPWVDRIGPKGRVLGRGRRRAGGRGRGIGVGPNFYCICPKCGEREPHHLGVPCFEQRCPKCGEAMRLD